MGNDSIKDEAFDLRFYIHRNIIYHARRAGFYNFIINSNSLINIALGSAAMASIQQAWPDYVTLSMAAIIALLSATSLVYGCTEKAWVHRNLRASYKRLEVDLYNLEHSIGDGAHSEEYEAELRASLLGIKSSIKHIEIDEPETSRPVEIIARNDTVRALFDDEGADEHMISVGWFKRMTANIINWNTASWK